MYTHIYPLPYTHAHTHAHRPVEGGINRRMAEQLLCGRERLASSPDAPTPTPTSSDTDTDTDTEMFMLKFLEAFGGQGRVFAGGPFDSSLPGMCVCLQAAKQGPF